MESEISEETATKLLDCEVSVGAFFAERLAEHFLRIGCSKATIPVTANGVDLEVCVYIKPTLEKVND